MQVVKPFEMGEDENEEDIMDPFASYKNDNSNRGGDNYKVRRKERSRSSRKKSFRKNLY